MGSLRCSLTWDAAVAPWWQRERGKCMEPAGNPVDARPTAASSQAEDSAMAARCRAGDLQGYERLYALHGARMKNLARNMLGNPMDAEDAVQETFLKIQRSIASFRGQSSFVTWAYRILVNTCYDARRRRVRKKLPTRTTANFHRESRMRRLLTQRLRWRWSGRWLNCRGGNAMFFCCTKWKAFRMVRLRRS